MASLRYSDIVLLEELRVSPQKGIVNWLERFDRQTTERERAAGLLPLGAEGLLGDASIEPGFRSRFLAAETRDLLRELQSHGIEAVDLLALCFSFAPRRQPQGEPFHSAKEARDAARWLRKTSRELRRVLRAVFVPFSRLVGQGKVRMVTQAFPALLIDKRIPLLGPLTAHERQLWEIAGTDGNAGVLQECATELDHHAPLFDRPKHRRPNFKQMLFIREWEALARRKARRPLDRLGTKLFGVVFGKAVEEDTFKRLRYRVRTVKWAQPIRPRRAQE